MNRPIHEDFTYYLQLKEDSLSRLYIDLRNYILGIYPDSNELLYHTHALTSVYSISAKLSDAFCHIPIYSSHLNLGFNRGTLLDDPEKLLQGTGKLIRHIPIKDASDLEVSGLRRLIEDAINFSREDMDKPSKVTAKTISKIKGKK